MGLRVPRLSSRGRFLLLGTLSVALWYTLFGFFVAPRILKAVVLWQLPKRIGRAVALQKIRLNPFTISITVRGFAIAERDGRPFVGWDEVYINLDPTGLLAKQLVVSQVSISNAFGHVQVNRDGSFNFSDIIERFPSAPTLPKKDTVRPLVVRVGQLQITGSRVVYDDLSRATPFSTTVGPINVTLHDFSTDPNHKDPYAFTAITESGEKFSWSGHFYLGPIRSSGAFVIEGIQLKKYAPYYDGFVNLTLHDGQLDLRAHYQVEFTDRLTLAQLSNTTVNLRSLKIAERAATNNVLELAGLTIAGLDFDLLARTVVIDSFIAHGGRAAVRKLDDGLPNLAKMFMKEQPVTATGHREVTAPPKAWQLTLHNLRADDHAGTATGYFGDQHTSYRESRLADLHVVTEPLSVTVDHITLDGPRLDQLIPATLTNLFAQAATTEAPASKPAPNPVALPSVRIGSFIITNGVLTFADESLAPPARLVVTGLTVRVTGFSTDTNGVTDIHLAARVGSVAPVDVNGRINPFAPDATTAMQVAFKGIDLVPMGGYSGRYAGYLIRKGRLSLDLQYDIQQRALKAKNRILFDQFTFGKQTDSPDAVKLPVKLAVAILKDRNGQIKLDVPVAGRIDDPKFQYWGAVWHVLGTLFTKVFTAPFAMLGSMFGGGGEELGWQEFAPGSAQLLPEQATKLDVLIKALTERPGLLLEIEGNIDTVKDREPLQRQKLERMLRTRKLKAEQPQAPADTPLPPLSPEEYTHYLRLAYTDALAQIQANDAARLAAAPPPQTNLSTNVKGLVPAGARPATPPPRLRASQARKTAADLSTTEMERAYLELIPVTPDDFRQLAESRAANVQEYFRQHGQIAADRITIVDLSQPVPPNKGTRASFSLQ